MDMCGGQFARNETLAHMDTNSSIIRRCYVRYSNVSAGNGVQSRRQGGVFERSSWRGPRYYYLVLSRSVVIIALYRMHWKILTKYLTPRLTLTGSSLSQLTGVSIKSHAITAVSIRVMRRSARYRLEI